MTLNYFSLFSQLGVLAVVSLAEAEAPTKIKVREFKLFLHFKHSTFPYNSNFLQKICLKKKKKFKILTFNLKVSSSNGFFYFKFHSKQKKIDFFFKTIFVTLVNFTKRTF